MDPDSYCKRCWFFEPYDEAVLDGGCHVMPPSFAGVIAPHGNATFQDPKAAVSPTVQHSDWCGKFQPIPKGAQDDA